MNIPEYIGTVRAREFWNAIDWSKSDREIQDQTGKSIRYVKGWRKRLSEPEPLSDYQKRWLQWEQVDWSIPVTELALSLGVAKDVVSYWKHKLDKPDCARAHKPLKPRKQTLLAIERRTLAKRLYETECKTYAEVASRMNASPKTIDHWIQSEKFLARNKLSKAVARGLVSKSKTCESCGIETRRMHGHHIDYANPFEVLWLCPKCHGSLHWVLRRMGTQ